MTLEPVHPGEGWGVLHLFFPLRRDVLGDPHFDGQAASTEVAGLLDSFTAVPPRQVQTFSVLGQKADLGFLAVAEDLTALDRLTVDLSSSQLGLALVPAASYVSLTELGGYGPSEEEESARLAREEGLDPGSPEHDERLAAWRERMAAYAEHRLHPQLPQRRVVGFYPMSKRRDQHDNWYLLSYEERRRLMGEHAATGRRYRGRVTQLVTGSTGLDDWEWAVTLFADDPADLKSIVYDMRFDEVSARYAEFGPFVTGLAGAPAEVLRHQGVRA